MDMGVTEEQTKEFPSNSEDEQDSDSDQEEEASSAHQSQDSNNNKMSREATSVAAMTTSSQGSAGAEENDIVIQGHVNPNTKKSEPSVIVNPINEVQPSTSNSSLSKMPDLHTFNLMQTFMLKKGLIDRSMTEEEIQELVNCGSDNACKTPNNNTQKGSKVIGNQSTRKKGTNLNKDATGQQGKINLKLINKSPSELTVYRRAIPSIPLVQPQNMNQQIEAFIGNVRESVDKGRKISTSSEEAFNTSDESVNAALLINSCNIVDDQDASPEVTAEEQAEDLIRTAEKSRARLFEVPGKTDLYANSLSTASMNEDYQMIDSHIDEGIKCKIQCFVYVNFCKLTAKNKILKDDNQQLEIVSKNGMTYFAPVDRDYSNHKLK